MADDAAQWNLPDSDICTAAMQLVMDESPAFLANHCVRSFLYGRELAAAQGLRAGVHYDEELVFLSCLLHDLGITDFGRGDQRFEVDGADAAATFLREHGVSEERTTPVWQAIALHTSLGIADRFGPVPAVSFHGITLDIDGAAKAALPQGFVDRVHARWPRHDLGYAIAERIGRDIQANPMKAPPFSFPAHIHELLNGPAVTFWDVVEGSPWGDRPVNSRC
ncbi:HD domain-containing protein [Mycolicibacterium vaccae]|nr:HD domain-containing protein [Mycolicibacterium vaccae]MCV7059994.1 HD domain-containing protein [Mycolicibacterium vaccae]